MCNPILVVDDNDFNLFTFVEILKGFNLEADKAINGLEALEMVKKSLQCCPYQVVFMDVNMPIMDGLEATREIRKSLIEFNGKEDVQHMLRRQSKRALFEVSIPIVALTANDTNQERQVCSGAGMDRFLSKPPDRSELIKILQSTFGSTITE